MHLPYDENRVWFNLTHMTRHDFESASVLFYIGKIMKRYPNQPYQIQFYRYISATEVAEQYAPKREVCIFIV